MSTAVLSSPPGYTTDASVTLSASTKSALMGVSAIDPTKETLQTDADSPTSSAADLLSLGHGHDVQLDKELEEGQGNDREIESESSDEDQVDGDLSESFAGAATELRPCNKRRRVFFECADIVEFEPTVYTTSITSGGVPVGLSLNERSRSRRRLDSFEMERADERVGRQNYMEEGYLDPQEREIILNNAGCEEPVIASVEAEVNAIIQHRRESNEIDFSFMYVAEEDDVDEDEDEEEEEDEEQEDALDGSTGAQHGDGAELKDQSEHGLMNDAEHDARTTPNDMLIDQEIRGAEPETLVHQCSNDDPVAAVSM